MCPGPNPIKWSIAPHPTRIERAYLKLQCAKACTIPLGLEPPKLPRWHWDGNMQAPTVTPSINCSTCGLHISITKGAVIEASPTNPLRR
jgi:hypothetical protein